MSPHAYFTLRLVAMPVLAVGVRVVEVVHRVPLVGSALDRLLDTMFGPEDAFDYVSTTAPSTPPPGV